MPIGYDVTALSALQSGVGTYTINLLSHIAKQTKPSDQIIHLTNRSDQRVDSQSHQATQFRLNKTLWMQFVLPWQIRNLQPDVCHFTNNVGPFFGPSPMVITIHDMSLWMFPEYHYRKHLLAMRPFIPLAARRAAAAIT